MLAVGQLGLWPMRRFGEIRLFDAPDALDASKIDRVTRACKQCQEHDWGIQFHSGVPSESHGTKVATRRDSSIWL